LIGDVVDVTSACGAVRHGAECFNFYFPQELDPDFLVRSLRMAPWFEERTLHMLFRCTERVFECGRAQVVWDGLESPPWKTVTEPELRAFLLERAAEGFSFPLNPVWPVRDPGWAEVLHELQQHEEANTNLKCWFPPESGVLERIEELHAEYPGGFGAGEEKKLRRRSSFWRNMTDCDTRDVANLASLELVREVQARWVRIRVALRVQLRLIAQLRADAAATKAAEEEAMKSIGVADAVPTRIKLNEMTASAAGDTPDLQSTLYSLGGDENTSNFVLANPYAGVAFKNDEGGTTTAIANLGVNLVRHKDEHCDLALGLRVDTGGSYGADRVMGYVMGVGGEVGYDKDGRVGSIGAGIGLFKFNYRLRPTAEPVEEPRLQPIAESESTADRAAAVDPEASRDKDPTEEGAWLCSSIRG